jgi:hypothetical protein
VQGGLYIQIHGYADCCMIAARLALSLSPIFLFFLHCHIKLDWVKANDFKLRTAIITFDNIALIGIFINLDVRIAFGTRSFWHVPLFLRHRKAFCYLPYCGYRTKISKLKLTGFARSRKRLIERLQRALRMKRNDE